MRLMTKKEMKQDLKEVNKRKKFREALLQLVKNRSMNKPEIKTVYLPVKLEDASGNYILDKSLLLVKEQGEMDKFWIDLVSQKQGYFFTPEQLNQLLSDVIKDALYQATQFVELQYECGKKTKEECVAVFCNNCLEQVDNSSIYLTFDKIFEKWKI